MEDKTKQFVNEAVMLVGAAVFNFLVYFGGRFLAADLHHFDFTTALDRRIPLQPWMILIYWGCYLFWIVNYILSVKTGREEGKRFITAHFIGEVCCFLAFVFLPAAMVRPEVTGTTPAEELLKMTYRIDSADNLFPSIHCFVSWLCFIGVRGQKGIGRWYRIFSFFMAAAVCVSTLTVKQHVIADVAAGIILAEGSYYLAGKIRKKYMRK